MGKLFISCAILFLFSSCKENKGPLVVEDNTNSIIATASWPKKAVINAKATDIIKDWPKFSAMDTAFDALYTVENPEDVKLVIENLIENQKLLEASKYPEVFDVPQIKSRQKVFKTYILKIKGNLEYRLDVEEPVLEMITAYNALRNQFNVIVNNTLDTKLILEE
ncbi:hypothetical protein [Kriegella aquimaris]|uniref:Uncharacterized protein n=1 Tax=Kriegella aquimaris TaxID=192904 RepID=A0A1G9SS96_9FLAO|nr:hypothetical protein [Kriegella aquimaris]SDM37735.1 hypothetical protein SAMN04488514_10861 [Kriegella aquimaris]